MNAVIGPWIENAAWAAAFASVVIFADGWWKLMALACFFGLNSITFVRNRS